MNAEAPVPQMTYTEYCVFERDAASKHEYLRGEVFAMTGGTLEHGRLGANIIYLLKRQLEGRPCRVFSSDVRVRVEPTDLDTYPDASVVCEEPRTADEHTHALVNPSLVVEVLSDSTEAYDRGQKASHYRQIPTLRAYLLISQHEPRLELQVRQADGHWALLEASVGERLTIAPLKIELNVDEVYAQPPAAPGH